METTYKIALAQLRTWKISTQNMCKKRSKLGKNEQKCQKLLKKDKNLLKDAWKQQRLAKLWKNNTCGASVPLLFPSLQVWLIAEYNSW